MPVHDRPPQRAKTGPAGDPGEAPDFNLLDQDGKARSLKDFSGKTLVLYFFPKANTPG